MSSCQSCVVSFANFLGILLYGFTLTGCGRPSNRAEGNHLPRQGSVDIPKAVPDGTRSAQLFAQEQARRSDAGRLIASKEDLEKEREYVTKVLRTSELSRNTILRAQRAGIPCERLGTWVSDQQLLDAWGQQVRGSCVHGKMVMESRGSDRAWGPSVGSGDILVSEDELVMH